MTELRKWADFHQYDAEPQPNTTADDGVRPSVTIIDMPSDPLGKMAAQIGIYKGQVIRSLSEVTDEMRTAALENVQATHLKAPLEFISIHFLIEGVDRAFTHQHVRQRTAVYGQESMRFAVLGDLLDATTLPPSLAGTKRTVFDGREAMLLSSDQTEENRRRWDNALRIIDNTYHYLVEHGMPAEEARGLLPHCTATRIHYETDLRNLSDHAGNRLCTQAQFPWREVFSLIVDAIRNYTPNFSFVPEYTMEGVSGVDLKMAWEDANRWQFEAIADSGLFRPICYQLGHCPFNAEFDRSCVIRSRVEFNAENGIPSSKWDQEQSDGMLWVSTPINPAEWMLRPDAARKVS